MANLTRLDLTPSRSVVFVLLVAAAFLFSHPFTGIRHDGTLYFGDALSRLLPGEFHDDLYFSFGSQGRFTLLPALYAALITTLGLGTGTIVGMLAAFTLYLIATWYLVSWLSPSPLRAACVLSVVLGWTIYGGNRIFAYSEPFLTARSFAEPAVLFGLGFLVRRRFVPAALGLGVAFAIHPLIAAGGLLVAWLIMVRTDRRWIAAGGLAVIVLAVAGLIGLGPFNDLYTRYDPEWLALVHEANGHAFVLRWSPFDYGIVIFDVAALYLTHRVVTERAVREFIVIVVVAGLGAMGASVVLVDLIGNPFFGKLQIWRAEWILQWVAMASIPLTLTALWREGEHGRVAACFVAIGWMAPFSVAPGVLGVMAVTVHALSRRFVISRMTTRIVIAVTLLAFAAIVIQYELRVFKMGTLLDQTILQILGQALAMNIALLVAALLFFRAAPRLGWFAPLIALSVFCVSADAWDQRSAWTRKLESYPIGTHIWPGLIEPDAKVYWYRDLIAPWVLLGHGNYYTQQQGSGAVFSRDMVVELDKRRKVTALLDFQEQICRMLNNLNEKQTSCEPDAAAVRTLCVESAIDYIVLQSTLEGKKPLADFSTGVTENGYEKKFFLYRCSALN